MDILRIARAFLPLWEFLYLFPKVKTFMVKAVCTLTFFKSFQPMCFNDKLDTDKKLEQALILRILTWSKKEEQNSFDFLLQKIIHRSNERYLLDNYNHCHKHSTTYIIVTVENRPATTDFFYFSLPLSLSLS